MSIEQRDRILACACDLYLADGLDGFSMRKLARALGVTAPALYRHYESKERVLLDVVGEAYQQLVQYLHGALQGRTPEARFRMAGERFLDFALEHPRYYEVLFMGVDRVRLEGRAEVGCADVADQGCALNQFWSDRLREAMGAGLLELRDPEASGVTLWAHSHGLIALYLKGMLPMSEAEFRKLYRDSNARVMQGLGTRHYAARLAERLADDAPERGSTTEAAG
jgi:AcrR family transcriptional regulator